MTGQPRSRRSATVRSPRASRSARSSSPTPIGSPGTPASTRRTTAVRSQRAWPRQLASCSSTFSRSAGPNSCIRRAACTDIDSLASRGGSSTAWGSKPTVSANRSQSWPAWVGLSGMVTTWTRSGPTTEAQWRATAAGSSTSQVHLVRPSPSPSTKSPRLWPRPTLRLSCQAAGTRRTRLRVVTTTWTLSPPSWSTAAATCSASAARYHSLLSTTVPSYAAACSVKRRHRGGTPFLRPGRCLPLRTTIEARLWSKGPRPGKRSPRSRSGSRFCQRPACR